MIALPFWGIGQDQNADISKTAQRLSGIWLLESYEKDSLRRVQLDKDGQAVFLTYINNKLQKTEKKDGWYVIKLSFKADGNGDFQEYYSYQQNSDNEVLEIVTCQPMPQLTVNNGKVAIHMTYMFGEGLDEIVELSERTLITKSEEGIKQTFRKIE